MNNYSLHSWLPLATAVVVLAAPPSLAAVSCAALAQELKIPHTTITLAAEVPAGGFKLPGGGGGPGGAPVNFASLPAFCRVAGTSKPTADSDIRFEVWMPLSGWNGKFVGGGNGVWAGSIAYGDMVTRLRNRGFRCGPSRQPPGWYVSGRSPREAYRFWAPRGA
jgi:feruloyl esterase